MAGASRVKNGRIGPFQLTRRFRYKSDWDGFSDDNLGKIYEAYNVHTGASAVVVIPDRYDGWWPSESWQVRASTSKRPPYVALEVEQAPASGLVSTVAHLCELFTTVLAHMDQSKEARAHLTHQPVRRLERWADRWRRLPRSRRRGLAVAPLAVLGLGVAFGLYLPGGPRATRDEQLAALGGAVQAAASVNATILVQTDDPKPSVVTYPLPAKPFDNQAKAPCKPKKGELEINGGCWVELAKRPPCYEDQAEYQGKCYLPVAERRKPEPNSLQP